MSDSAEVTVRELADLIVRAKQALSEAGRPDLAECCHVVVNENAETGLIFEPAIRWKGPHPTAADEILKALDIDPHFTRSERLVSKVFKAVRPTLAQAEQRAVTAEARVSELETRIGLAIGRIEHGEQGSALMGLKAAIHYFSPVRPDIERIHHTGFRFFSTPKYINASTNPTTPPSDDA